MAKISLSNVTTGQNVSNINDNFTKIQDALNNGALWRQNVTGESNQMSNLLDMNAFRIINLAAPIAPLDAVRYKDLQDSIAGQATAVLTAFEPYQTITAINVQGAIQQLADTTIALTARNAKLQYVDDFGAIGNGTTDDTAAINLARAAGVKRLLAGKTYLIADVNILLDLTNFVGDGSIKYNGFVFPILRALTFINIPVPSCFPTIDNAFTYVRSLTFTQNGFASINVADGTYNGGTGYEPNLAFGDKVQIIGNQTTPGSCIINFNSTGNNGCGFAFYRGNQMFLIDGFTLNGNAWVSSGVWADQSYGGGVVARYGSYVKVGGSMRINQFYYGVQAQYNSRIEVGAGCIVNHCGDCGYHAFAASAINANNTQAYDCSHITPDLGFGYCSENGSFIDCSGSNAANNLKAGFYALGNGSMWAHGCSTNNNQRGFYALGGEIEASPLNGTACNSYNNTLEGYNVSAHGSMNCNSAQSNNNGGHGFSCGDSGFMDITVASASNNGADGFNCYKSSSMEGDAANAYNNTLYGFHALDSASISGSNYTSNMNKSAGFGAGRASILDVNGASAISNSTHGFEILFGSTLVGDNLKSNTNTGAGFTISANSNISGSNLSANNNTTWGYLAYNLSFMDIPSAGGVGNTSGFRSPPTNNTPDNNTSYINT